MDSDSFIIATETGSYWGKAWGVDGVTFVKANAYRYASADGARAAIVQRASSGDARAYHVEAIPPGRRARY